MLKYIARHPVPRVTIGGGIGKMTKLAQGARDLHSKRSQVDFAALADALDAPLMHHMNTALEAYEKMGEKYADWVASKARERAAELLPDEVAVDVVVIDRAGQVIVPTRIGGFGGAEGFTRFLHSRKISAVLDATHPFAARISHRSAELCAAAQVPYCLFVRPPWSAAPGDRWTHIATEAEAARHIPLGATVFLATGRQTLHRFEALTSCYLICRQIDPPEAPFPWENGEYLIGTPPFSVSEEVKLFQNRKVDWLVVKNAGGAASQSKLIAARKLGLRVAMIDRPPLPQARQVSTQEDAIAWARAAHG